MAETERQTTLNRLLDRIQKIEDELEQMQQTNATINARSHLEMARTDLYDDLTDTGKETPWQETVREKMQRGQSFADACANVIEESEE